MKKSERLNGLIYAIKEEKRISASKLSKMYEVSERTIYRDIDALSQLKVPIISYEGLGGGYEIDPSYFLPSIQLTEDEAIVLLMLLKLGDEVQFPNFKSDYKLLKSKLLNSLDHIDKPEIEALLNKVYFYISNIVPESYDAHILKSIINSFINKKRLSFVYYHPRKDEYSERTVSPKDLHFDAGAWYLTGKCHLRYEKRIFRLDRISQIQVIEEPIDTDMPESKNNQYKPTLYTLEIHSDLYRIVKENFYFSNCNILSDSENMLIEVMTDHERHILHLLLEHPDKVTIVKPQAFKEKVKETASKLYKKYL